MYGNLKIHVIKINYTIVKHLQVYSIVYTVTDILQFQAISISITGSIFSIGGGGIQQIFDFYFDTVTVGSY